MEEFVMKASVNPGRIIGFANKGHLGEGADADITVFDYDRQEAFMSIGTGRVIMYRGIVCGSGCTIAAATKSGVGHVREYGLEPVMINVAESGLYKR